MKGWRPSLRYSGVFVHQRPYCTFNGPNAQPITLNGTHSCKCELGDLLVVFSDHGAQRRVAALLQAKMAAGSWPPLSPNPDQWTLYTSWPTFRYTPRSPSASPGPQLRTVPFTGSSDPAAQYVELDSANLLVNTLPAYPSRNGAVWASMVNRILNGGAGRDFAFQRTKAKNDWDKLIWDLLDYTFNCAMPGGASSGAGGIRGAGSLLNLATMLDVTGGDGPGDAIPSGIAPDDSWGIPIIHLERGEN